MKYSINSSEEAFQSFKDVFKPTNMVVSYEAEEFLFEMVNSEMEEEGFDPLNKDDIKEYWRRKGINI